MGNDTGRSIWGVGVLGFIQRQGLDKFLEKAPEIKQRYYRGKMEIGKGPQLK